MYRWENDGSQKRTPHKSVELLKQWYQRLPGRVAELLAKPRGSGAASAKAGDAVPLLQPAA